MKQTKNLKSQITITVHKDLIIECRKYCVNFNLSLLVENSLLKFIDECKKELAEGGEFDA